MKNAFLVASLLLAVGAQAATSTEIECSGVIAGKTETLKTRLSASGRLVFWSKKAIVSAAKSSYFAWLADADHFGLEGQGSFTGENGYRILRVINTAEVIAVGVSPNLKKGFFQYQDIGSGLGNLSVPMDCKALK